MRTFNFHLLLYSAAAGVVPLVSHLLPSPYGLAVGTILGTLLTTQAKLSPGTQSLLLPGAPAPLTPRASALSSGVYQMNAKLEVSSSNIAGFTIPSLDLTVPINVPGGVLGQIASGVIKGKSANVTLNVKPGPSNDVLVSLDFHDNIPFLPKSGNPLKLDETVPPGLEFLLTGLTDICPDANGLTFSGSLTFA